MRVLITNDDGINAPGLQVLRDVAAQIASEVWVVAPETDQSGLSHSLTLNDPLRLRKIEDKVYALRGTPTDCVIMGIREVLPETPDLVLTGINSGQNISDDVTYSGTIAAAMEGTMLRVPSIALSQSYDWTSGNEIPWNVARDHSVEIIQKVLAKGIAPNILVNINFPSCASDKVEGVKIATQGALTHGLFLDKRDDARGNPYYWLTYRRQPQAVVEGTDLDALEKNFISLTPLKMNLTAENEFDRYADLAD
ncbi:MAG: 5'/3'-nucleotidase SurE [Hyphomicrobiales bacterium]